MPTASFSRQVGLLVGKNFRILGRNRCATVTFLLSPLILNFVLILFAAGLEGGVDPTLVTTVEESVSIALPKTNIPFCTQGDTEDECITLAYSPANNSEVDALMDAIRAANDPPLPASAVESHATPQALNEDLLARPNVTQAAVIFHEDATGTISDFSATVFGTGALAYTIQVNSSLGLCAIAGSVALCRDLTQDLILPIQYQVERAVINGRVDPFNALNLDLSVFSIPHPQLIVPDYVSLVGPILAFVMTIILYTIFLLQIAAESESKIRLYLRTVGTNDSSYWTSWILTHIILTAIHALVVGFTGIVTGSTIFSENSPLVYLPVLFAVELAMAGFAYFTSVFVTTTRSAFAMGFGIWLLSTMINLMTSILFAADDEEVTPGWLRVIMGLFPPVLFQKFMDDLARAADAGNPIEPSDWSTNSEIWPFSTVFLWGLFDTALYILLTMYFDQVYSSVSGKNREALFFLKPSYWTGAGSSSSEKQKARSFPDDNEEDEDVAAERAHVAKGPEALDGAPVIVQNLSKWFPVRIGVLDKQKAKVPGWMLPKSLFTPSPLRDEWVKKDAHAKDFIACADVSFHVKQNELFALLGPNGAGKSTLINMLISAYHPSGGDALIDGHSIVAASDATRGKIGVCPQFDIQWAQLTGKEHLELFAGLKGLSGPDVAAEAKKQLEQMGLWDARDRLAGTYSGGMRRRLSVGISLTAAPAVVFLDEPTTGMDPASRRFVWKVLEKVKKERSIVLTTHSMEEADILADRIGIIAHGKLTAIGDSVHLKSKFGAGYSVSVVLDSSPNGDERAAKILSLAQDTISGVTASVLTDTVVTLAVPPTKTGDLPKLFDALKGAKSSLGIAEFSVSLTTLEQVFNKVATLARKQFRKSNFKKLRMMRILDGIEGAEKETEYKDSDEPPAVPSPPSPRK